MYLADVVVSADFASSNSAILFGFWLVDGVCCVLVKGAFARVTFIVDVSNVDVSNVDVSNVDVSKLCLVPVWRGVG